MTLTSVGFASNMNGEVVVTIDHALLDDALETAQRTGRQLSHNIYPMISIKNDNFDLTDPTVTRWVGAYRFQPSDMDDQEVSVF